MRLAAVLLVVLTFPALALANGFFTLKGHGGPVMGLAVAPDGRVATASFDNSVGVWTAGTPAWHDGHEAAVNTVLFDGNDLYSAGDDFTLRRWPSGVVLGRHKGKVMALSALPGVIAAASWDGTIGLWPRNGQGAGKLMKGHGGGVNALAATADGTRLFSASADGTIRIWDPANASERRQLVRHGFGINKLALNEAAGWLAYGAVDGVTRIIDPDSGALIADFTLDRRPILALALTPDGRLIAVGDGEGYIMVIDTAHWRIAQDFRATLRGPVWALAFSPDGQTLYAGGLDDAAYAWPVDALDQATPVGQGPRAFLRPPEEMSNGERQFARKCSICHALTPSSARRAGPTLYRIFGRRAGTVPDYSYSQTLDRSKIIWNDTTINALFDLGPDHYIPGTKMPMQRITKPQDRADLVDFLRQATAGE